MKKLVIASNNAGKLREIARILAPLDRRAVRSPPSISPTRTSRIVTFIENCLPRRATPSAHSGLPALADDSGICVDALNGAPGVYSARFAGEPKSDERNNQKLIEALQGQANRRAHYYCVIVLVRWPEDPAADHRRRRDVRRDHRHAARRGRLRLRPVFPRPELGQTGAELRWTQKNTISATAARPCANWSKSLKAVLS